MSARTNKYLKLGDNSKKTRKANSTLFNINSYIKHTKNTMNTLTNRGELNEYVKTRKNSLMNISKTKKYRANVKRAIETINAAYKDHHLLVPNLLQFPNDAPANSVEDFHEQVTDEKRKESIQSDIRKFRSTFGDSLKYKSLKLFYMFLVEGSMEKRGFYTLITPDQKNSMYNQLVNLLTRYKKPKTNKNIGEKDIEHNILKKIKAYYDTQKENEIEFENFITAPAAASPPKKRGFFSRLFTFKKKRQG
jgi:hypothetical protein